MNKSTVSLPNHRLVMAKIMEPLEVYREQYRYYPKFPIRLNGELVHRFVVGADRQYIVTNNHRVVMINDDTQFTLRCSPDDAKIWRMFIDRANR